MKSSTRFATVGVAGIVILGAATPAFASESVTPNPSSTNGVTTTVNMHRTGSNAVGTIHIDNNSGQSLALAKIDEYQMNVNMPKLIPAGQSADITFSAQLASYMSPTGQTIYAIKGDDQALVTTALSSGYGYTFHLLPAQDGNMTVELGGPHTASSEVGFSDDGNFTTQPTFTLSPNGS